MAKAKIEAGSCGFQAYVEAKADPEDNYNIQLKIESDCKHIQKLADDLTEVNALGELSHRRGDPVILQKGAQYCTHASCPVPVGIMKTVEVAAGLSLPQVAKIEVEE